MALLGQSAQVVMTHRRFRATASKTVTSRLISLVEDDEAVRNSLANLLNSAGLTVESFSSAEEFLSSARADMRSCLILDVKLPRMRDIELKKLFFSKANPFRFFLITPNA